MKEVKALVKKDLENNIKKENIIKKRNKRMKSSNPDERKAFVVGLKDECPQCGEVLEEVSVEEALKQTKCVFLVRPIFRFMGSCSVKTRPPNVPILF